jgi:hypothetical protein
MCYCKNGASDLEASISSAEDKLASLPSEIKAAVEKLAQLKADVKQHQTDKQEAKDAMAEATAIREKEAAAFAKEKTYYDSTITAITKAVAALEKGVAGGFLQTSAARLLRTFVTRADMDEISRQTLTSFLSGTEGYAPQSGQIIGILKQMGDTMAADLATATATEEAAIKTYDELMASKKEEIDARTASIESKLKEIGEVGIEVVEMKEDVDDTAKALAADKKFLAELQKGCATKTKEWEERSKIRAEELVALADTIKILNDDDALEMFKKTLPSASASFVQVLSGSASTRSRAVSILRKPARVELDLIALALNGKQQGFENGDSSRSRRRRATQNLHKACACTRQCFLE